MSKYMPDGSPVPSKVPLSPRKGPAGHFNNFKLYKGMIVDVIYPENENNSNGERVEYQVKIKGQLYPNAVDIRDCGSKFNFSERIRTHRTHAYTGNLNQHNYDENLNGEPVYCLMFEGDEDVPIIIGSAIHPQHAEYKKFSKEDGVYDYKEFNGIEFLIDKDSNYTITHKGRKTPKGDIENEDAVGSQIKLYGNGDFEITTHGNTFSIIDDVVFLENSQGKIFKLDDKQILGQGSEPVVLGDTLSSILDTFLTSIVSGVIPGSPGQNASSLLAISAAASTLKSALSTMLSPNSTTD